MRPICAISIVLVVCGVALCQTPAPASQPAKILTADHVKALIAKLGDADFKARDAAQKELVAAGPAVLDALDQAAKSDDAEVKSRAKATTKEIRDGIAKVVSAELAKKCDWSYPLPNGALDAPVLHEGKAYVVGLDWKLHAVDAKTGKPAWAADLSARGQVQVSIGEKVVALISGTVLTALDPKDGNQLWRNTTGNGGGPMMGALNNMVGGPFGMVVPRVWVVGDAVVARVAMDKLKAYRAFDGNEVWETELKTGTARTFCVPIVEGGILYVPEGESLSAIDLKTQKRVWTVELANCARLARGGVALLCATGDKLVALDAKKGVKLWDADLPGRAGAAGPGMAPRVLPGTGLVADDQRAYIAIGDELTTFDLKKGEKATAKLDLIVPQAEEGGAATPVGGFGQGGGNAPPAGVAASTNSAVARWTAADGTLYGATTNALIAFEGKTGQRLWALPLKNQRITGDPVIEGDVIYVGTGRYGAAQPADEKTLDKDRPGLHAVKLPSPAAGAAPAKTSGK